MHEINRKEVSTSCLLWGQLTYVLNYADKIEILAFIIFLMNLHCNVTTTVLYYLHKMGLHLF